VKRPQIWMEAINATQLQALREYFEEWSGTKRK